MLRSDLFDYSNAYILVKGTIIIERGDNKNIKTRSLALKNHGSFINRISKINNILIDNAENLDAVKPMYNLTEYSKNYRKTTGSLWKYYRHEPNNPALNEDNSPTVNYNADPLTNSAWFKYKNVLHEKHKIMIMIMMQIIIEKKTQRCWNCCAIEKFKLFLENLRNAID